MHQVVEIASHGVALRKDQGHLVVSINGNQSKVPLDDIEALILSGGAQLSNEVLKALTKRGAPILLTDEAHLPLGLMLPCFQHHRCVDVLNDQIQASKPLQKKMWARIVSEKISNQASVLREVGEESSVVSRLAALADTLRSGDPDNKEAQAAILYWPQLFGDDFLRRAERPGINSFLNYGYAVVRASAARAVVAAGLHPALGIFHRNRKNAFCLVDDLMEPFRPLVDISVYRLIQDKPDVEELSPEMKRSLVKILYLDQGTKKGQAPIFQCLRNLAYSVCESYSQKDERLDFPSWALT